MGIFRKEGSLIARTTAFSDELAGYGKIRPHFKKLPENHIAFNARIDEHATRFRSLYLGCPSPDKNEILVDGLIPEYGNIYMGESSKISILYKFEGAIHTFTSRYLGGGGNGFASFRILLPNTISRFQKRKTLRVTPSDSAPMSLNLGWGYAEEVINISIGGVCFYTWRSPDEIKSGQILQNVSFRLPFEKRELRAKAIVRTCIRNYAPILKRGKSKCGVEFVDLDQTCVDAITKYVLNRLREVTLPNSVLFPGKAL